MKEFHHQVRCNTEAEDETLAAFCPKTSKSPRVINRYKYFSQCFISYITRALIKCEQVHIHVLSEYRYYIHVLSEYTYMFFLREKTKEYFWWFPKTHRQICSNSFINTGDKRPSQTTKQIKSFIILEISKRIRGVGWWCKMWLRKSLLNCLKRF